MYTGFLAAALLFALTGPALAKNMTITIPMNDITVKSGERGNYYVVALNPPAELAGKRLDSVFLDFVVDVTPTSPEQAWMAPRVGVFPLTESFTGVNLAYDSTVPSVRAVPTGENQALLVDITNIVKGWLATPSSNHGFVIGSLTGPEVGTVSLKDTALGPGAALRVTFFYQNRFGDRVSARQD